MAKDRWAQTTPGSVLGNGSGFLFVLWTAAGTHALRGQIHLLERPLSSAGLLRASLRSRQAASPTSVDLAESHLSIDLALGGEAGARLAAGLSVPTSPDTILRRVKAAPAEPSPPPRCVGIDDWACREGQTYGTILVDLERRTVIDLFPGRDGEPVAPRTG